MKLKLNCESSPVIERTLAVMNRQLQKRGIPCFELTDNPGEAALIWETSGQLHPEGYRIHTTTGGALKITGGSSRGILYGAGKMLRTADYSAGTFKFGAWRGSSVPAKEKRIIYFASHFGNFYHVAPENEVIEYIEELAMYGYNGLMLWVDKHHFSGNDDPELLEFVGRCRRFYEAASAMGMNPMIGALTNEGYNSTPGHLRAVNPGRGFYGCEICPSTPEGMALILQNHQDTIDWFGHLENPIYSLWPYDQGGCACPKCSPWGSNGMYKTAEKVTKLVKREMPTAAVSYSTWYFDLSTEPLEWPALDRLLAGEKDHWIDYILADSGAGFPKYPLEHGVPGNLPLLNFPEISMWGIFPWGAIGASPLPERFRALWGEAAHLCSGGLPYSEGIYEDFNKVLYAGFYWNGNNETDQATREYLNFEFGCRDFTAFLRALEILEKNHETHFTWTRHVPHFNTPEYPENLQKLLDNGYVMLKNRPNTLAKKVYNADPAEAYDIFRRLDDSLPEWGRQSWRWRILYLRALIDYRLHLTNLDPDAETDVALEELADIYHSRGKGEWRVSPVTRESREAMRLS